MGKAVFLTVKTLLLVLLTSNLYGQSGNISKILSDIESFRAAEDKNSLNQKLVEAAFYYWDHQDIAQATKLLEESATISAEIGNKHAEANAYHNLGLISAEQQNFPSSIELQKKAVSIKKAQGDERLLANYQLNLGSTYMEAGQAQNAINALENSLALSKKLNITNIKTDSYLMLSKVYELQGNKEKALEYFKLYNQQYDVEGQQFVAELKDDYKETEAKLQAEKRQKEAEITAQQKALQIAEIQKKAAETEMLAQQKEAELVRKENQLQQVEIEASRKIIIFIIGISILILVFVVFMIRANSKTKAINRQLEKQKDEISKKNTDLSQAYSSIQASINYAERIQQASLPELSVIGAAFDDMFIYFNPRDIVSGDFYWFAQIRDIENGHVKKVLAAVDCTGHGVPGAFMSLVGNSALNQIVNERKLTDPSIILSVLNERVVQMLKQEQGKNRDGMDMALIVIDETTKEISFAGAKNPFYFVKEGQLNIIKGSKKAIGGNVYKGSVYENHTIKIDAPMECYIFSDGYQDQFGGEKQSRFMSKRLKQLITDIHDKPMKKQHDFFEETFNNWKGEQKQVDDILVIGFKVSP